MLWYVLVQFLLRLTLGIAMAMAVTPSRLVTSGFYRVHLWVLMGFCTLASLTLFSQSASLDTTHRASILAASAAFLSYVGAVLWLYEKRSAGTVLLYVVGGLAWGGATIILMRWKDAADASLLVGLLDILTGALLLGTTITAMFLGHWYLNTPTMQLLPLKRLVVLIMITVALRAALCGWGLSVQWNGDHHAAIGLWSFVALRWLSGIVGTLVLAAMTWQTLKIPNTQSATGILYVGVICSFLG